MTYALKLITRDKAQAKARIATSDLPPALQAAVVEALNAVTTEDTSPNTYVVVVDAGGDSAAHEVSFHITVSRVEVLGDVMPVVPPTAEQLAADKAAEDARLAKIAAEDKARADQEHASA